MDDAMHCDHNRVRMDNAENYLAELEAHLGSRGASESYACFDPAQVDRWLRR